MEVKFNCCLCKKQYEFFSDAHVIQQLMEKCNVDFSYNCAGRLNHHKIFNLERPIDLYKYVCEKCQETPEYKLNIKKMQLLYITDLLKDNSNKRERIESDGEELKAEIEEMEKNEPTEKTEKLVKVEVVIKKAWLDEQENPEEMINVLTKNKTVGYIII